MDPEIDARIAQYEMAFRMQTAVPDAMDLSTEPDAVFDLYGPDARKPGTFAANCLLARRLAERNVRFIQLYHQGWDQHGDLPKDIQTMTKSVDQASAALVIDLKQRGLLDDTLVIWGGEFGRTIYSQGKLDEGQLRPRSPSALLHDLDGRRRREARLHATARPTSSATTSSRDPVHVHDLQATLLHLLGIDHERLMFKHQGRRYRLTDVHGHVVKDLLA